MHRPLRSFPLASTHKAKLSEAGYETVDDLRTVRVEELSKGTPTDHVYSKLTPPSDLSVSHTVALEIIQVVRGDEEDQSTVASKPHNGGGTTTALDVLKGEQLQTPIVTFCASIDEMLGGGVQTWNNNRVLWCSRNREDPDEVVVYYGDLLTSHLSHALVFS